MSRSIDTLVGNGLGAGAGIEGVHSTANRWPFGERPLRIGMVCPYSLTVPGGVQAQVLGLATRVRRLGHEVRVLAPCDGPPPEPFVTSLGESLPTSANGSIAPVAPDIAATLRTIRALRGEGFDVLHVHEPLAPGAPIATVTMQSAPIVGTFHAAGRSSMYRVFGKGLRRFLRRIDYPVAVSKDAANLVGSYLGGRYEVLWNGIEVELIESAPPAPSERPAILFLGRHEERKGLQVLLEAVTGSALDVVVWVTGDGPDTARLRRQVAGDDRIRWFGRVTEEDKLSLLRGAAVVCAPSLGGESFGIVLAEAMAASAPVVASSLDGYRNVATDGVDSVLVPPGDVHALRSALSRVISDQEFAETLATAGRRRVEELSMARLAERYLAIYRSIVTQRRER